MLLYLLVIAGQWLFAAVLGLVVLSFTPPALRTRLWPAAPTIGLSAAVVALCATSLVVATRLAAPVLVVGTLVAACVQLLRHRGAISGRALPVLLVAVATLATAAAGVAGVALAVGPARDTGAGTVLATSNHDAFFYVGVAEWLSDNTATSRPVVSSALADGGDPPATGVAVSAVDYHFRLGDTLLSAAASTIAGVPVARFWSWQVAGWLLMLPATFAGVARMLDRRPTVALVSGLAAGAVVSVSSLIGLQIHNQNSAAILGLVQAPLAMALWWSMLRTDDEAIRPPRWLVALVLCGTLGSYSEYLPMLAIALGVAVLARAPSTLPAALARAVTTGALALALAPAVWWRLVNSLLFQGSLGNLAWQSPFHHAPAGLITARLVGASSPLGPRSLEGMTPLALVLLGIIAVGLALFVWRQPSRWLWLGFGAGALLAVWHLTTNVQNFYSQERAVEVSQPLILGLAVLGWGLAFGRGHQASRLGHVRALAPVVVVSVVLAAANARLFDEALLPPAAIEQRAIDADFADLADWARRYGGTGGEDLTVVVPAYVDSMWATDALRDWPEVSYLRLSTDYFRHGSYTDGVTDRYLVTGTMAVPAASGGAVIEQNARFMLLDLAAGPIEVVIPAAGFYAAEGPPEDPSYWMADRGELVVVQGGGGAGTLLLDAAPLAQLGDVPIRITDGGGTILTEAVVRSTGEPTTIAVPLRQQQVARISIESLAGAEPPSGSADTRLLSVYLNGFEFD